MMRQQRGLSLVRMIIGLAIVGFLFVMGAKLLPAYLEYYNVKKVFAQMKQAGAFKGTVKEIRYEFDKRNAIEDIRSIASSDLEVTKEGGETVVSASWSAKIPMVGNASACLDFYVTSSGQ